MNNEVKTILAIEGSVNNEGTMYTKESIKKAAEMHKNLSVGENEGKLTLVWNGVINDININRKE